MIRHELESTDLPVPSDQALAKAMFQVCIKTHPHCRIYDSLWRPTRLIRIMRGYPEPKLQLIDSSNVETSYGYFALSHCWGTDLTMKLTGQNIQSMKKNIAYGDLPKSFQDAITVSGWFEGQIPIPLFIVIFSRSSPNNNCN
jgi:hypothetical protein